MSKDNKGFFKNKNEWSKTKDQLLGCYLRPYFQKVLATNKKICYVDCFSGKGKFDDGSDGSPLIALDNRDKCLESTRLSLNKRSAIEMTFIDLNYAEELSNNVASHNKYGIPKVVSGRYEDKIFDVLSNRKFQNVFLYIDPYGIRALDMSMFDAFKSMGFNSFEMLINLNSFGFFRNACRVMSVSCENDMAFQELDHLVEYEPTVVQHDNQSEQILNSIAGGDYWKRIVIDYRDGRINGYQAEKRFSKEYKEELKKRFKYVLDMPIRLRENQRPKYRMVHVSDHPDACFLMAQNMQNRKKELYINVQAAGQLSIFDLSNDCAQSVDEEVYTRNEIRELIKRAIQKKSNEIRYKGLITDFVNEHGLICDFKMIQDILSELQESGLIDIIRNPALKANGKASAFWEDSGSKMITIRRLKL